MDKVGRELPSMPLLEDSENPAQVTDLVSPSGDQARIALKLQEEALASLRMQSCELQEKMEDEFRQMEQTRNYLGDDSMDFQVVSEKKKWSGSGSSEQLFSPLAKVPRRPRRPLQL